MLLGGIVASGQYYIEAYVGVAPRVQRFTLQVALPIEGAKLSLSPFAIPPAFANDTIITTFI